MSRSPDGVDGQPQVENRNQRRLLGRSRDPSAVAWRSMLGPGRHRAVGVILKGVYFDDIYESVLVTLQGTSGDKKLC